jgi:MFS family permease
MPLIYPFIQKEYNLSYTQIGLIVAIPNAVGGLLQIVFGLLSRYILRKVMLGVGSILVGVSTFFTGTIGGYWSLMLWSLLSRIAGASQHPVYYSAARKCAWSIARRSPVRYGGAPRDAFSFLWKLRSNDVIFHPGCKPWYAFVAHSTGIDSDGIRCLC